MTITHTMNDLAAEGFNNTTTAVINTADQANINESIINKHPEPEVLASFQNILQQHTLDNNNDVTPRENTRPEHQESPRHINHQNSSSHNHNPLSVIMQLQQLRQELSQLLHTLQTKLGDKQLTSTQIAEIKKDLADIAAIELAINGLISNILAADTNATAELSALVALSGAYSQIQSNSMVISSSITARLSEIKLSLTNILATVGQITNWQPLLQLSNNVATITNVDPVLSTQNQLANMVASTSINLSTTLAQVDNPTKSLLVTLALSTGAEQILREVQVFLTSNPGLSNVNAFAAFNHWLNGTSQIANIDQSTLQFANNMDNLFNYMSAKLARYNQQHSANISAADLANDSAALASNNNILGGLNQQQFLQFILYDDMVPTAMQTGLIGEELVGSDTRKLGTKASRHGKSRQK